MPLDILSDSLGDNKNCIIIYVFVRGTLWRVYSRCQAAGTNHIAANREIEMSSLSMMLLCSLVFKGTLRDVLRSNHCRATRVKVHCTVMTNVVLRR